MRYRRGNEAEYGEWNRILDPPAQLRRMAAEGVRISLSMERALVTGDYKDAQRAHREGQWQRRDHVRKEHGHIAPDTLEDAWKWNPLTQRVLAFSAPFVLVSAGLVLAGLCSRKPHLVMGRSVVPRRHQSIDGWHQNIFFLGDVALAGVSTGLLGLACIGVTSADPFEVLPTVLTFMPVEQLVAVIASAAAAATLLPSVRPLPVFGCALGVCGTAVAAVAYSLVGIQIAKRTDAAVALDKVFEVLYFSQTGHIAERKIDAEAVAAWAAVARRAEAAAATAEAENDEELAFEEWQNMERAIDEGNQNWFTMAEKESWRFDWIVSSAFTVFNLWVAGSARDAMARGAGGAISEAMEICRVASGARGAGFIAGYGLFKLGLTAGPVGDEQ